MGARVKRCTGTNKRGTKSQHIPCIASMGQARCPTDGQPCHDLCAKRALWLHWVVRLISLDPERQPQDTWRELLHVRSAKANVEPWSSMRRKRCTGGSGTEAAATSELAGEGTECYPFNPTAYRSKRAILPRRVGKLKNCSCTVPAQGCARSPT